MADQPPVPDPALTDWAAVSAAVNECVGVIRRLPEELRPRAALLVGDLFNRELDRQERERRRIAKAEGRTP